MRNCSALGLIFANMYDDAVRECTAVRSMGSVPYGGRYRLIDFPLSNMVNAGITKVGVITKSHYQSLMDHLGSGKAWDLSRKNEGLFFLPPRSSDDAKYQGRVGSLKDVMPFLHHSKEDLVVLADCHMVASLDLDAMIEQHKKSGADVTFACRKGHVPNLPDIPQVRMDMSGRVMDMLLGKYSEDEAYYGIGVYIVGKDWLMRTVNESVARNHYHFERILQSHLESYVVQGYVVPELVLPIYSLESYFKANLALLEPDVRAELFPKDCPVYTKLLDYVPAHYGLHGHTEDSLVADGAFIDGNVKNCIIFRGVTVCRDANLENCVIMQGATVEQGCTLKSIVADKNVLFREGRALQGSESYPVYIAKNTVV